MNIIDVVIIKALMQIFFIPNSTRGQENNENCLNKHLYRKLIISKAWYRCNYYIGLNAKENASHIL